MSGGLFASRWAATPEPTAENPVKLLVEERGVEESKEKAEDANETKPAEPLFPGFTGVSKSKPGAAPQPAMTSRWADTPPPDEEEQQTTQDAIDAILAKAAGSAEDMAPADEVVEQKDNAQMQEPARGSETTDIRTRELEPAPPVELPHMESNPLPSSPTKLEPPRLRRRVSWRGRNIVISIPHRDLRLVEPMSKAEIDARLKLFEAAGYDVSGYDLTDDMVVDGLAQVKEVFPDETESRLPRSKDQIKVLLPDLERWKAYENSLVEAKLAALGVSLGFDEPAPLPPSQLPPTQGMSRQSSGQQYPPLPFSPPIPTGSAGSMGGRPPMVRGHTHTMSVASPASPMNGPFGHMHRHSTFTGGFGFPQFQQSGSGQSPSLQNMQPFSPSQFGAQDSVFGIRQHSPHLQQFSPIQQLTPAQQFQQQYSALQRAGSPGQTAALRQDLGNARGPASPLSQQILPGQGMDNGLQGYFPQQRTPQQLAPQPGSSVPGQDFGRRQHGYSQSMTAPTMPNQFFSQGSSLRPTPALPELPEDEEEEDQEDESEPERPAYVPPHKRAQANAEIAVPTPRGHRHNISEGLERDLIEAEKRQKEASRDWIEVTEEEDQPKLHSSLHTTNDKENRPPVPKPVEKDPLGDHPVQESTHGHKKSASRFNVAAPSFTFNPAANFQPVSEFKPPEQPFTFSAPTLPMQPKVNGQTRSNHNRQQSSGSFNATAPPFKPTSTDFNFAAPAPKSAQDQKRTIIDDLPSIFGKINIPDIVKPARRNKAVAIVRPEEKSESEELEDEQGRILQGDAKRSRKVHDDGDSVPQFAEPTPITSIPVPANMALGSNSPDKTMDTVDEVEEDVSEALTEVTEKDIDVDEYIREPCLEEATPVIPVEEKKHVHRHSTSLSALAKPFVLPGFQMPRQDPETKETEHLRDRSPSISELEEGEIPENNEEPVSPVRASTDTVSSPRPELIGTPSQERIDTVAHAEPSFDEIDAVMRQLNASDSERASTPQRLPSPGAHPMKGVTYLPGRYRSDAPSPSPQRQEEDNATPHFAHTESDRGANGYPHVRQLNRAEDGPTSDWSDIVSPPDANKFDQRSAFFDSHVDKLIGRAVERRLQPLEESLRSIQLNVSRRSRSSDLRLQRSSSNVESDADDEEELSDELKNRPISRGRDKRVDQIKAVVLEALREQSSPRSQQALDVADLHSVLADMKVSFARAASSSLELDDIRAVIEDTMARQSQALIPVTDHFSHKRELSELEGRLNETLAGALEEANQRRAIEGREAESRRQLRLAEEEMQLLRDSARDDEAKVRAMEKEREDLVRRLESSEDARRQAEDRYDESEAEKEALQATLEEYRTSSHKWRADIERAEQARQDMETKLQLQADDYADSTSTMRRRLESLRSDMATATGQLASEKATWKSREEEYRSKIDHVDHQLQSASRERTEIEEDLRVARLSAVEGADTRPTIDHLRESNNALESMLQKVQGDLAEQQERTARYECQLHDAQESAHIEVQRTRMALEAEIENANHQVHLVRAELESELNGTRAALDNARMELETVKDRHDHLFAEEETNRREAIRKVNHSNSIALDEARHKYESGIQELTTQHSRALRHALEDKDRIESYLNERLGLSDAKHQHYQERCVHLEECLEVAKSAAQAAALNARIQKSLSPPPGRGSTSSMVLPEKISPQALRESILVLQEQLQQRETQIERLEADLDEEGVQKVKARDEEIAWLRELLSVRNEELEDLVKTLQKPNFDRLKAQGNAIRLQANLDMERQEKDRSGGARSGSGSAIVTGQAQALLTNFATPKAAEQLGSVFAKWRSNMESSALKNAPRRAGSSSGTPSKQAQQQTRSQPRPPPPQGYHSGLMTPPASNVRSSPIPEETEKLPLPLRLGKQRTTSGPGSRGSDSSHQRPTMERRRSSRASSSKDGPQTLRLFSEQSYDRDAQEEAILEEADGLDFDEEDEGEEDDDLLDDGEEDAQPPGFRAKSLMEEMGE